MQVVLDLQPLGLVTVRSYSSAEKMIYGHFCHLRPLQHLVNWSKFGFLMRGTRRRSPNIGCQAHLSNHPSHSSKAPLHISKATPNITLSRGLFALHLCSFWVEQQWHVVATTVASPEGCSIWSVGLWKELDSADRLLLIIDLPLWKAEALVG